MTNKVVFGQLGVMMLLALGLANCSVPASGDISTIATNAMASSNVKIDQAPTQMPLPRDPQLAVQEEFGGAKAKNTQEAWGLFLRRHPDNVLSPLARSELQQLRTRQKK